MKAGGIFGQNGLSGTEGGGVFGDKAVSGLGELGTEAYKDALAKAKWNGCNDAQQKKPLEIGNALNFWERTWANSSQEYAAYEAYRAGYAGCSPLGPEPPTAGPLQPTNVGGALTTVAEGLKESLTPGATTPEFTGPLPDSGAGKACTSAEVIKSVQAQIGVSVDGKWGPASQAAIKKIGRTFKSYAPQCTEPVPSYGGISSGGGGTTVTPGPGGIVPPPGSGFNMSTMTSSPVFWTVLLVAGVGGYFYLTGDQNSKKGRR